jgi:hypothetical protein
MQNKYKIPAIELLREDGERSLYLEFAAKVSKIPEVTKICFRDENNYRDVFVIFNSKNEETRNKIYQLAQDVLLTNINEPIDFHTINLSDFEESEWQFIIPTEREKVPE